MRPRAKKLWDFLLTQASPGDSWYGTYAELSEATGMSKKELSGAITDLENGSLLTKINHGRAGIELALSGGKPQAAGDEINNCGYCGAEVENPEHCFCTRCGRPLRA